MEPKPLPKSTGIRRAAVGVVALVVGVVGIAWLLSEDERPAASVEATLPPPVEEPRVAIAPAPVASAADAEVRIESAGEMQMCGGTWVKLQDDGEVDGNSVAAATKESVGALSASVIAAMAASADEQARAAALALAMPPIGQARVKPSACEGDVGCERDSKAAVKAWAERRDELARLAQDSSDPTVYGWAVRACTVAVKEGPGHCQVIHAAQWARLDPTNAAPWIEMAATARAEKDAAGLDDALFRISAAERYDPGEYRLAATVLDHVPDTEANLWGALSLVSQGLGFGGGALDDVQTLALICAVKEQPLDDARRETCERSAEMLLRGSTTLNGLMIGRVIGKRIGWPQERLEPLEKEGRALDAAREREHPKGAESLGCKALRAQLDSTREFAAEGQVAALRRRLAQEPARAVASTSVRAFTSGVVPSR